MCRGVVGTVVVRSAVARRDALCGEFERVVVCRMIPFRFWQLRGAWVIRLWYGCCCSSSGALGCTAGCRVVSWGWTAWADFGTMIVGALGTVIAGRLGAITVGRLGLVRVFCNASSYNFERKTL